ncbi:MAG TPA: phosphate-starvation-inducible PsiE family protein [Nitrospiraceae bacterium]|nr:phosphate-starvation-inducible PsiE family protein [Nitrospiraceae bacterium]
MTSWVHDHIAIIPESEGEREGVVRQALCRMLAFDPSQLWNRLTRLSLSLLIVTIQIAFICGVGRTLLDIPLMFQSALEVGLRQVIVDALILLAVVEVLKTTLTYFSAGRVKVTFIVDTILVVMLTEVISEWFQAVDPSRFGMLGGILLVLAVTRVVAVRFSPAGSLEREQQEDPMSPADRADAG